jgi:hypothetical protein
MQCFNFFDWRGKEINCCLLLEDTYILGRQCEGNVNFTGKICKKNIDSCKGVVWSM